MSMKKTISVRCPECGCEMEATMWESINVTLDPELKQKILDDTFNEVVCGNCGKPAHIMYPFLYHDMEKERIVNVLASQGKDDPEKIAELESLPEQIELSPLRDIFKEGSYEFRIVSDLNGLKEKILIWDAGLDDCVIEVVKAFTLFMAQGEQLDLDNVQDVFFYASPETKPEFQLYLKDGKYGYTPFVRESYDKMLWEYADFIESHRTHKSQKIDLEWGFQVVEDILGRRAR